MSITVVSGGVTVQIAAHLHWSDELSWHPRRAVATRTLTGALVIGSSPLVGGRPLTLRPSARAYDLIPRSSLLILAGWVASDAEMVLTLHDSSVRSVRWDLTQESPIDAAFVREGRVDPSVDEPYHLRKLAFIIV